MRFREFVFFFCVCCTVVFFVGIFFVWKELKKKKKISFSAYEKRAGAHARENRKNESRCTIQRKRERRKEGKRERISK